MGFNIGGFDPISAGINLLGGLWQTDRAGAQADHAQQMSAAEAATNRDFQRDMSNTQYQRATADMKAAGLNPMLAYSQGGAGTPPGATGSGFQAQPANMTNLAASLSTAAQIRNLDADTNKKGAEAKKTEGETTLIPIQARAMEAQIQGTYQNIEESVSRIRLNVATAAQAIQNVDNMKAMMKQIDATVDQLKAQTKATAAQTGLTEAMHTETVQRIAAQLPQIEAARTKAQEFLLRMQQPEAMNQAGLHSTFVGAISTLLQAFNPLRGFMSGH